jgi:hypothetical protein
VLSKGLRDSYSLASVVSATKSRIRWAEIVALKAKKKSANRGLLRKRGGKRPLGRPGR